MPCPSTDPKKFCASPNYLCQSKNLIVFSASSKTFVLAQKPNLLNANYLFVGHKMFLTAIDFWSGTKNLDQPKIFWDM